MKILIVDAGTKETFVSKIDTDKGEYQPIRNIKGYFNEQAEAIVLMALKERPEKIIVDKIGVGYGLYDYLLKKMELYGLELKSDATVVYKL
jgi:hypothetical protein